MSNTHDEQIATWNQQRGPRVGDWCETKDKQPERKPGAIHQPHFTMDCRVFKKR